MDLQIEGLLACIDAAKGKSHRLVLVTGNPGSGKSQILREASAKKKWDYIDCRTLVSDEIIELLPAMRASKAPGIMGDILEGYDADVLLLDRVQTLFTPVLQLNPLALLRSLSEKYTLVVAWPGYYKDGNLFFERAGEPAPLKFDATDLIVWSVEESKKGKGS
ncbi:MAG: BREX-3 system P-loop-containing protein BrxF [Acidaminococcales bacterium]|nr:BREX-3 system P-loop-containing protein BrxF [Acidaminococcales bacterium]